MVVDSPLESVDHRRLDLCPGECGSDWSDLSDQPLHRFIRHVAAEKRLSLEISAEVSRHFEKCHPILDKDQRVLSCEDIAETASGTSLNTWSCWIANGLTVQVNEIAICFLWRVVIKHVVLHWWPSTSAALIDVVHDTWHLSCSVIVVRHASDDSSDVDQMQVSVVVEDDRRRCCRGCGQKF